ncbi:hypothetical protein L1787_03770 [Acuticoccus sp. M5D2P5]|uniref:hypothetical protein n=1 Tax=Acuticoccus kalidii TaxID=2910977 RepID=UPI001F3880BF|nr:hypothetical protein [Acuticoccus kalidii]MCF3932533.1 hypothetical protein [Acuticoccus kalidii]
MAHTLSTLTRPQSVAPRNKDTSEHTSERWRAHLPPPERQAEIAERLALALEDESETPVKRPPRVIKAMPHPGAQPAAVTAEPVPLETRRIAHSPQRSLGHRDTSASRLGAGERRAATGPRRIAYVHPEIFPDLAPARPGTGGGNGMPPADPPMRHDESTDRDADLAMARAEARRHATRADAGEAAAAYPVPAPRARAPHIEDQSFLSERTALLRDVRRVWMGSAFKRSPYTLLLVSVRLVPNPNIEPAHALPLLRRTHKALTMALDDLGVTYRLAPFAIGVCLADKSLRHTARIAEAVERAVAARLDPDAPVVFAAGAATLHRDDDPAAAVCLAEHCLRLAEIEDGANVVLESDPRVRRQSLRRA